MGWYILVGVVGLVIGACFGCFICCIVVSGRANDNGDE